MYLRWTSRRTSGGPQDGPQVDLRWATTVPWYIHHGTMAHPSMVPGCTMAGHATPALRCRWLAKARLTGGEINLQVSGTRIYGDASVDVDADADANNNYSCCKNNS